MKRQEIKFPIKSEKMYSEALKQADYIASHKVNSDGILVTPLTKYEDKLVNEIAKYEYKHNIE